MQRGGRASPSLQCNSGVPAFELRQLRLTEGRRRSSYALAEDSPQRGDASLGKHRHHDVLRGALIKTYHQVEMRLEIA